MSDIVENLSVDHVATPITGTLNIPQYWRRQLYDLDATTGNAAVTLIPPTSVGETGSLFFRRIDTSLVNTAQIYVTIDGIPTTLNLPNNKNVWYWFMSFRNENNVITISYKILDNVVGGGGGISDLNGDVTTPIGSTGSVTATVTFVGGQTSANVATGAIAANAATNLNTPNTIVKRDASGNFASNAITASSLTATNIGATTMSGVLDSTNFNVKVKDPTDLTASSKDAVNYGSLLTSLSSLAAPITQLQGDVTTPVGASGTVTATVAQVGGQTAANVSSGTIAANAATNLNTPNTIVKRDGSGDFSANNLTVAAVNLASATTNPSQAPTWGQVQTYVNQARVVIKSCATISLVNQTLATNYIGQTINGRVLVAEDRVALTGQSNQIDNGIYRVQSSNGHLVRAPDCEVGIDGNGFVFGVLYGTYANYFYRISPTAPATTVVFGTDVPTFDLYFIIQNLTADNTTTQITGNTISVKNDGVGTTQLAPYATGGRVLGTDATTKKPLELTATSAMLNASMAAYAANIYVSNGGSDTVGNGYTVPYLTLTKALSVATGAGVIYLAGGVGAAGTFTQSQDNQHIQGVGADGSQTANITGSITAPSGRTRLKIKDLSLVGTSAAVTPLILASGNLGRNYFKNVSFTPWTTNPSININAAISNWMVFDDCDFTNAVIIGGAVGTTESYTFTRARGAIYLYLTKNVTCTFVDCPAVFVMSHTAGNIAIYGRTTVQISSTATLASGAFIYLENCSTWNPATQAWGNISTQCATQLNNVTRRLSSDSIVALSMISTPVISGTVTSGNYVSGIDAGGNLIQTAFPTATKDAGKADFKTITTSSYSVTTSDSVIYADATSVGSAIQILLPAISTITSGLYPTTGVDKEFTITKIDNTFNWILINTTGSDAFIENKDDRTQIILYNKGDSVTVRCVGQRWAQVVRRKVANENLSLPSAGIITNTQTIPYWGFFYLIDATGGNITITLPLVPNIGIGQLKFYRKDAIANTNTVTIVRQGSNTINGSTSPITLGNNASIIFENYLGSNAASDIIAYLSGATKDSARMSFTTVSADYTLTADDALVYAQPQSTSLTIYLPLSSSLIPGNPQSGVDKAYTIIKRNYSPYPVTIQANAADTIVDNAVTTLGIMNLEDAYDSVTLHVTGNYWIPSSYRRTGSEYGGLIFGGVITTSTTLPQWGRFYIVEATSANLSLDIPYCISGQHGQIRVYRKDPFNTNYSVKLVPQTTMTLNGSATEVIYLENNGVAYLDNYSSAGINDCSGFTVGKGNYKRITSTYTILGSDRLIYAEPSSNSLNLTLPAISSLSPTAQSGGFETRFTIIKNNFSQYPVSIFAASSDSITDSNSTASGLTNLFNAYDTITLSPNVGANGTTWMIINCRKTATEYGALQNGGTINTTSFIPQWGYFYSITAPTANITLTLPQSITAQQGQIRLYRKDTTSYTVTVIPAGSGTINGDGSASISIPNKTIGIFESYSSGGTNDVVGYIGSTVSSTAGTVLSRRKTATQVMTNLGARITWDTTDPVNSIGSTGMAYDSSVNVGRFVNTTTSTITINVNWFGVTPISSNTAIATWIYSSISGSLGQRFGSVNIMSNNDYPGIGSSAVLVLPPNGWFEVWAWSSNNTLTFGVPSNVGGVDVGYSARITIVRIDTLQSSSTSPITTTRLMDNFSVKPYLAYSTQQLFSTHITQSLDWTFASTSALGTFTNFGAFDYTNNKLDMTGIQSLASNTSAGQWTLPTKIYDQTGNGRHWDSLITQGLPSANGGAWQPVFGGTSDVQNFNLSCMTNVNVPGLSFAAQRGIVKVLPAANTTPRMACLMVATNSSMTVGNGWLRWAEFGAYNTGSGTAAQPFLGNNQTNTRQIGWFRSNSPTPTIAVNLIGATANLPIPSSFPGGTVNVIAVYNDGTNIYLQSNAGADYIGKYGQTYDGGIATAAFSGNFNFSSICIGNTFFQAPAYAYALNGNIISFMYWQDTIPTWADLSALCTTYFKQLYDK